MESGFSKAATGAGDIFSQMRFFMAVNGSGITITGMEDTKLLKRSSPEVFNGIEGFYKNYPDFYSKELLCFEEDKDI